MEWVLFTKILLTIYVCVFFRDIYLELSFFGDASAFSHSLIFSLFPFKPWISTFLTFFLSLSLYFNLSFWCLISSFSISPPKVLALPKAPSLVDFLSQVYIHSWVISSWFMAINTIYILQTDGSQINRPLWASSRNARPRCTVMSKRHCLFNIF